MEDDDAGRRRRSRLRGLVWRFCLFGLFLIYPGVSSKILGVFLCHEVDGTAYLVQDFALHCYDDRWWKYATYALALIIAYPVGIPACFFALLYRARKSMQRFSTMQQLGFLYSAYGAHAWYWEVADMANKLFLTSIMAFFPRDILIPAGMVWVGIYTMLVLYIGPYARRLDDRLCLMAQSEVLLLLLAGLVLRGAGQLDYATDVALSAVLITVTLVMMLVFVFNALLFLRTLWWERKRDLYKLETQRLQDDSAVSFTSTAEVMSEAEDSRLSLDADIDCTDQSGSGSDSDSGLLTVPGYKSARAIFDEADADSQASEPEPEPGQSGSGKETRVTGKAKKKSKNKRSSSGASETELTTL